VGGASFKRCNENNHESLATHFLTFRLPALSKTPISEPLITQAVL